MTEPLVLREDDARLPELLAGGWSVRHRSWGARLRVADPDLLTTLAAASGYEIVEADAGWNGAISALESAARSDYPGGPATAPAVHDVAALVRLRSDGTRFFAALHDRDGLVAVTAIRRIGEHAETDFTSVSSAHRRRGLAEAVKAASVLSLLREGVVEFGTGGAEENVASLAMNARLGYAVTERWLTLVAPRPSGVPR